MDLFGTVNADIINIAVIRVKMAILDIEDRSHNRIVCSLLIRFLALGYKGIITTEQNDYLLDSDTYIKVILMGEKKQYKVSGDELIKKIKEIIKEGNARRVRIIHNDRPIVDIPLTLGVGIGAITVLTAPVLAAIGAIAALVTEVTIEVEKNDIET